MTGTGAAEEAVEASYRRRAKYYDPIYHWKDYAAEAARLRQVLHGEGIADGARLLEAACGTGSHIVHLRAWYEIEGFDRSAAMLEIARTRLPGSRLFEADMTSFTVERPFDALLCLFSSIGYLRDNASLRAAAARFAAAVRPGGAIIIEPWLPPEVYQPGRLTMQTFESPDLKLCRMVIAHREADMAVMEFHWLAAETGAAVVEHFIDRHELRLCPHEMLARAFGEAGFDCRIEPHGLMKERGLLIGRRR